MNEQTNKEHKYTMADPVIIYNSCSLLSSHLVISV